MSEEEVRKKLLELKENADVMIDLAYSSLIYDNADLANEVYELEEESDALAWELQRIITKDSKEGILTVNETLALLRFVSALEEMCDGAREIADVELRDIELHPVLKLSIESSDEIFLRETLSDVSSLCDKTLGELRLASEFGAWVIAVKRGNRWYYNPGKYTHLKAGDILYMTTTKENGERILNMIGGKNA
ncbi:MAG: TrkA C-terminal domain-containing protein [Candidatus Thermoplasmatota archaeon]|nr:TrkA C-terminal domain-containing protein [Candidatus Thermoplasmatota archaeon]